MINVILKSQFRTLGFKWPFIVQNFKGSSDPSHFIFEINVGKSRIRHTTTLKLSYEFLDRLKINWRFKFRVIVCRIRFFLTLISKRKWLWSEPPWSGILGKSAIIIFVITLRKWLFMLENQNWKFLGNQSNYKVQSID